MYRKHFALAQHPFGPEIAPEDLFPSTTSRECDIRLAHLLDLRGIGLITGDSGSGKTCACRKVLMQLHTGLYRVIYVSLSTGNVMDLYKTISWEMGLPVALSVTLPRSGMPVTSSMSAVSGVSPVVSVNSKTPPK